MTKRCIIIGGGFSGLAAASKLASSGYHIILIEQRRELGGRASSFFDRHMGLELDNGQHILMGCNENAIRFLSSIGAHDNLSRQDNLCIDFMDADGQGHRLRCPSLPAPFHLFAGILRFDALRLKDRLKILYSSKGPASEDSTVSQWLDSLGQGRQSRESFWDILTYAIMNESPDRASARLFHTVLRKALLATRKGSNILLPSVPLGRLYTGHAEDFIRRHGGQVEKGCIASDIIIKNKAVTGIRLRDGSVLHGDYCISAVPYQALKKLLPHDLMDADAPFISGINELKSSPIISIHLQFDRSISGYPFAALINSPVQWIFDKERIFRDSRYRGLLSLVISGAHAYVTWDKERLLGMALQELKRFLPRSGSARLLHSRIIRERFATISPLPGIYRNRPDQATPVRNLYLAGDWTDTGLPSTIEGAVLSGYRCAELIMNR